MVKKTIDELVKEYEKKTGRKINITNYWKLKKQARLNN